jgi:hypothetical protein
MTMHLGLICTLLAATACSNNFDGNGDEPEDNNPLANTRFTDDDGDGYTEEQGDCDDSLAAVNPGEEEVPYDGLDNDCDKSTRDDDLDRDGYGIEDDCDDENKKVNPGRDETVYNGVDDDCNENTPDDDLDDDGFGHEEDCDDEDNDIYPGAEEITDNEVDDDCDGEIDERFDVEVVDASCDCGASSAISVTRRGTAHVIYADADAGTILYKTRTSEGQWSSAVTIVDVAAYAGEYLDISVDNYGLPHIAFTLLDEDGVTRKLYYMFANSHGTWSTMYPVDSGQNHPVPAEGEERVITDVGAYVDIEMDSSDNPVFAYMDSTRGVPVVAVFTQNGDTDTLDQDYNFTGATGQYVSLGLDRRDSIHTVFHNDGIMNDVRYTHWDSFTFSEVVDPREGFYTSMDMIGDTPCVSFYDDYDQDLIYGCRENNGSWTRQQVLKDGNVGAYSSLVITKENVPNVLYYDGNSDSLRMVHKPTIGGWKIVEVDKNPGTGAYVSTATDPDHNIYMTYYDQATGALKFAVGQ